MYTICSTLHPDRIFEFVWAAFESDIGEITYGASPEGRLDADIFGPYDIHILSIFGFGWSHLQYKKYIRLRSK